MEHINEKKIREILENCNKGEMDETVSVFLKAESNYTSQIADFISPYSAVEETLLLAALYACAQAIEKKMTMRDPQYAKKTRKIAKEISAAQLESMGIISILRKFKEGK